MGREIQYILESKRFVWLVAVVFAVVITFRYFEFSYGNIASSLFSMGTAQTPVNGASQTPHPLSNITSLNSSNYTARTDIRNKGNSIIDKGYNVSIENGVKSETNKVEEKESLAPNDDANANISTLQETHLEAESPIPILLLPPPSSPAPATFVTTVNTTLSAPANESSSVHNLKEPARLKNPVPLVVRPPVKESYERRPMGDVVTISEMHDILAYNRASLRSMKPLWSSTVDQELLDAKLQIENAPVNENDRSLYPPIYLNVSRFKRSYELMEKTLKVYIYEEGEKPIFHQPQAVLDGIYASEGWFMKNMKENKQFVTKNAKQAHLFYLPFSSRMLEEKLYVTGSHSRDNLVQYLKNYLSLITGRYNFWNRTGGSDHFLVACHDWATDETRKSMDSCIRALCNSDVKREGFKLGKDVSLPETYVRSSQNPSRDLGGKPPSQRPILAFFAGQMHGNVRPILLKHWENKDPDMKIFGKLRKSKKNQNYIQYMKTSRYCICPKGYEVNSPRVVEAIFYECVPVIISDNFVPPFCEILNWESFAVFVKEKDIPNLKNILGLISNRRYEVMQQRVKQVQQHFVWHVKPVKYDIFHMILHSIWYNRVFRVGGL